jgi:hypothetical protein
MQPSTYWPVVFGLVLSTMLGLAVAQAGEPQRLTARSSPHTVALLELYTSEGCNSCPPADTWVSSLPGRGFRPDQVVPLALHVDYWDYLGWPDRFAQPLFTQRQRTIAAHQQQRTIYTPQVVLQGKDFRDWRSLNEHLQRINQTPAQASITLEVVAHNPAELEVSAEAMVAESAARSQAAMVVAVYENKLHSVVTAGENQGHTLQHDFVTRQWFGPVRVDEQGIARFQRRLSLDKDWRPAQLGLVVFVQNQQNSDVLQALALPLRQ